MHNHKRVLSTKVVEVLQNYHWPGNVRELENIIEQLVIMAKEDEVAIQDLPKRLIGSVSEEVSISLNAGNSLHEVLECVEKE